MHSMCKESASAATPGLETNFGLPRPSEGGNMSATSIGTIVKESLGGSIGLSVLMIVAGVLAIVVPPAAGIAVALLVAWLLIFSGTVHLAFAWHTRTIGGVVWKLLWGILYILGGAYLL